MFMLRLLTSFSGTIGRGAWWLGAVVTFLLTVACMTAIFRVSGAPPTPAVHLGLSLAAIYAYAALMVKRAADIGLPMAVAGTAILLSVGFAFLHFLPPEKGSALDIAFVFVELAFLLAVIGVCGFLPGGSVRSARQAGAEPAGQHVA